MSRLCIALYDFQNTFPMHIVSFSPCNVPTGKGITSHLLFAEGEPRLVVPVSLESRPPDSFDFAVSVFN